MINPDSQSLSISELSSIIARNLIQAQINLDQKAQEYIEFCDNYGAYPYDLIYTNLAIKMPINYHAQPSPNQSSSPNITISPSKLNRSKLKLKFRYLPTLTQENNQDQ